MKNETQYDQRTLDFIRSCAQCKGITGIRYHGELYSPKRILKHIEQDTILAPGLYRIMHTLRTSIPT